MTFPYRTAIDEEIRAAMRRHLLREKRCEHLLAAEDSLGKEAFEPYTGFPLVAGITTNGVGDSAELLRLLRRKITMVSLDVHGTLVTRNQCDDFSHAGHFREISAGAKSAGLPLVMVSAMPSREGEGVARLLGLLGNPAVYELGHVLTLAVLQCDPYINQAVTLEMEDALDDLRRWLRRDILPTLPGVFREPKVVIVSLNTRGASTDARKWLIDQIAGRMDKTRMPLQVSTSDATLDIGGVGISKITGLRSLASDLGLGSIDGHIIAVGDSLNDVDLLDAARPGLLGCPSNAHAQVQVYVEEHGGIASGSQCLAGTIECLMRLAWRNANGK